MMIEDKTLVSLVLLVAVGLLVAFRTARYGWRLGLPRPAGMGFIPALIVWLGVPLTHPLSWVASIVAALSVPLLVYGIDGVRAAFTPQRKAV